MRKKVVYLEETKWMFENNNDLNPIDHLPNNI